MRILETERLRLRPLAPEDAPFMLELLNEPAYIRNIADKGVRTLAEARAHIVDGPMASYDRNGFGLLVVELKATGESLGICGLIRREGLEDPDVGFAFLERHWSKGYAAEAAAAALDWGLKEIGLPRVLAITAPDNPASARVLERVGLRAAGTIDLPQFGGLNRLFTSDPR